MKNKGEAVGNKERHVELAKTFGVLAKTFGVLQVIHLIESLLHARCLGELDMTFYQD